MWRVEEEGGKEVRVENTGFTMKDLSLGRELLMNEQDAKAKINLQNEILLIIIII